MDEPPDTVPQRAQVIAGRYRIIRALGHGGMGQVYEAEHVHTDERLAFKVMNADHQSDALVERFRREARASAKIASEHVVKVVDAGAAPELGGRPFLVMELLVGRDLGRHLEEVKRLSPKEALAMLQEIGRGVHRAHSVGIIHRDLKPDNVFLHTTKDGRRIVKVLDFGLAHTLDPEITRITKTGEPIGTPLYMSPEQISGKSDSVGIATDIWAIGMIAYELLAGTPYWQADTLIGVLSQIRNTKTLEPPSATADLPRGFDDWFRRSCAQRPEDRFVSVEEQMGALERILDAPEGELAPPTGTLVSPDAPTAAPTGAVAPRVARRPPRALTVVAIVLVSSLLAVGVIASGLHARAPSPPDAATAEPSAVPDVAPVVLSTATDPPDIALPDTPRGPVRGGMPRLVVHCVPSCRLVIDGMSYGTQPLHHVTLIAGKHSIAGSWESPDGGISLVPMETIDAAPGTTTLRRWTF